MPKKPIKKKEINCRMLLNYMRGKGYTIKSLASEIGCNEKTISRDIKAGEMNPKRLAKIEDILGVSLGYDEFSLFYQHVFSESQEESIRKIIRDEFKHMLKMMEMGLKE